MLCPNASNAAACPASMAVAAWFGGSIYGAPPMTRNRPRSRPKNCSRYSSPLVSLSSDALDAMILSWSESGVRPIRSSRTRSR